MKLKEKIPGNNSRKEEPMMNRTRSYSRTRWNMKRIFGTMIVMLAIIVMLVTTLIVTQAYNENKSEMTPMYKEGYQVVFDKHFVKDGETLFEIVGDYVKNDPLLEEDGFEKVLFNTWKSNGFQSEYQTLKSGTYLLLPHYVKK